MGKHLRMTNACTDTQIVLEEFHKDSGASFKVSRWKTRFLSHLVPPLFRTYLIRTWGKTLLRRRTSKRRWGIDCSILAWYPEISKDLTFLSTHCSIQSCSLFKNYCQTLSVFLISICSLHSSTAHLPYFFSFTSSIRIRTVELTIATMNGVVSCANMDMLTLIEDNVGVNCGASDSSDV